MYEEQRITYHKIVLVVHALTAMLQVLELSLAIIDLVVKLDLLTIGLVDKGPWP